MTAALAPASLSPEQQRVRGTAVGASEVAALFHEHRFLTPLKLYLLKRGELERDPAGEAAEWGNIHEPAIARYYLERRVPAGWSGREIGTIRHRSSRRLVATPDRIIFDPDGNARHLLQIKTQSLRRARYWGAEDTDEIPEEYRIQVQAELEVTELAQARLAVLLDGNDFRVYRIRRDEEFGAEIVRRAEAFWAEHMETGVAPAPIWRDNPLMPRVYPSVGPAILEADEEVEALFTRLAAANQELTAAKHAKDELEARVKAKIGTAYAVEGKQGMARWSAVKGRVSYQRAFQNLAAGLPPEKIAEILEGSRGSGSRQFRFEPAEPAEEGEDGE